MRRPTRSTTPRRSISNVAARGAMRRQRDDHLGHRRGVGLPGGLRHRSRLPDLEPGAAPRWSPRTACSLNGLDPNTTYYYRVTSSDAASNSSTEPPGAAGAAKLHHSLRGPHRHHRGRLQRRDHGRGHLRLRDRQRRGHAGADRGRGVLGRARRFRLAGRANRGTRAAGGAAPPCPDGKLEVDGASAGTDQTFGSGRALEFARRSAARTSSTSASASTSTTPTGRCSASRTRHVQRPHQQRPAADRDAAPSEPGRQPAPLPDRVGRERGPVLRRRQPGRHPCGALSAPRLRPAWRATSTPAAPTLSVDWLRLSPYPASGTFDSRVLDAGQPVNWDALSWTADTPAGTSVALSVRTGNTPTPDGSWSGFNPVGSSGGIDRRATPATSNTASS